MPITPKTNTDLVVWILAMTSPIWVWMLVGYFLVSYANGLHNEDVEKQRTAIVSAHKQQLHQIQIKYQGSLAVLGLDNDQKLAELVQNYITAQDNQHRIELADYVVTKNLSKENTVAFWSVTDAMLADTFAANRRYELTPKPKKF